MTGRMSERGPGVVRIASYNTRDFLDDTGAAARVVRAIDPDVLCLQEVPRRLLSVTRVAVFAQRCGMYWTAGLRGSGGTTVLTSLRVQVHGVRHVRLPVPVPQRRRGYAVAVVAAPGSAALTVASVHLSLDAQERVRHTRAILQTLGDGPLVVAGDLNEREDGAARALLESRMRVISPDGPTYPAARPRHRLDLVLASQHVQVVTAAGVELDPDDLTAASDHRPVWVDVVVDPASDARSQ